MTMRNMAEKPLHVAYWVPHKWQHSNDHDKEVLYTSFNGPNFFVLMLPVGLLYGKGRKTSANNIRIVSCQCWLVLMADI